VHNKIKSLTTHIPEENYEIDLEKLNNLNVNFLNPNEVNLCLKNNFKNCETKLRNKTQFLNNVFQLLLKINLIVPYLIWKFLAKPRIKEIEFVSTFRFAVALTLVPLYLLIITFVVMLFFSVTVGLIYLISSLLLALLAIKL
jgi:hypothetical protein